MLKIKLSRTGTKHKPFYRVIVAEAKSKRNGEPTDMIGFYDPKTNPPTLKIDNKKLETWLKNGAKPTETMAKLLK